MDDKRSTQSSGSKQQDFLPRVDATPIAQPEQHPRVLADGAVQQSCFQGRAGASKPGEDQRSQLRGKQFTEYRNPTPAHREQASAGSTRAASGGAYIKKQRPRVAFNFRCGKCPSLVCAGSDVRIFMRMHHPVLDPTFVERIKVYRHWEPETIGESWPSLKLPIEKIKKIGCADCEADWGVGVKIGDKYFFFIKIETLKVECKDAVMTYSRWNELPYHMDIIKDVDLMRHGLVRIPDDSPWPQEWH